MREIPKKAKREIPKKAKSPFQAILPSQFHNIVTKSNAPGPTSSSLSSSTPYTPFPRKISLYIFLKKTSQELRMLSRSLSVY